MFMLLYGHNFWVFDLYEVIKNNGFQYESSFCESLFCKKIVWMWEYVQLKIY